MAIIVDYDGSTLPTVLKTFRLTEVAESGRIGTGTLTVDDVDGDTLIVGHKKLTVTEDDCSVQTVFRGYVGDRRYLRGTKRTGAGRDIAIDTLDLNARLGFKVIKGSSWRKRPEEEIGDRLTAMLAAPFLSGLVSDLGFVDYPTQMIDGGDLRGSRPGDLLSEMAEQVGFNFFVYYDEDVDDYGLWFRDSNTSTAWSSSLRISNDLDDVDNVTTFAPQTAAELSRSPARTVSSVWMPFANGNVYRTRSATEATYEPRDGTAPNSRVKRRVKARAIADRYLLQHRNEEDRITTTLEAIPSSKVNLIRAGQRVQAKFTHYAPEGYDDFTWFRVLERTMTTRPALPDYAYDLSLVLSPQEPGCTTGAIVQIAVGSGSEGASFPVAPTPGNVLVAFVAVRATSGGPFRLWYPGDIQDTDWTWDFDGASSTDPEQVQLALGVKVATATDASTNNWACKEAVDTSVADAIYIYELSGLGLAGREVITLAADGWGPHDPGSFATTSTDDVLLYFIGKTDLHGPQSYPVPDGTWTTDQQWSIGNEIDNPSNPFGIPPYCEWMHRQGTGSAVPTAWNESDNGYEPPRYLAAAIRLTNGC